MDAGEKFRRGHYSTDTLPPAQRHELWSERGWPSIAALFKSTAIGEFSTAAETIELGEVAVSFASGTARLLERSPERIAADGIDMLGAGLLLEGEMEGTAGRQEFQLGAGEGLLFDLAQPITMTMSAGRSVQMAVPRALAEARLGPVLGLHGLVVPAAATAGFRDKLLALRDAGPDADAAAFVESLIEALAQAVRSSRS
ncbi:hypothetical protein ACFSCW_02030 [Sphingomonas tabacisoli]|uniref:Transcription regulator HTH AraC- type ligand binding domain-containing protein n=1 Tax=Sphingomonas tabacisoli TaxID=2249466 RepID=A0ABW4HZK6_9SPHN